MNEVAALELVDQYYLKATLKEQNQYPRGHLYWCPCCYFDEKLTILQARGIDPYHKKSTLFETQDVDPRRFSDTPHEPLVRPPLEADEELIVLRAKKRPVIVLSSQSEAWTTRGGGKRAPCALVAPIYSFRDTDNPEWKLWIRALKYRDLFWLPEDKAKSMRESFVRFDRVHVVSLRWLTRMGVRLHEDALVLITDWFRFYLTGDAEDYLDEYQSKLLRAVERTLGGTAS